MKMQEFDDDKGNDMNRLEVGECFLYGRNLINQKQNKVIGQGISYYQVTSKSDSRVEYTPIFDYMEKDKGEET